MLSIPIRFSIAARKDAILSPLPGLAGPSRSQGLAASSTSHRLGDLTPQPLLSRFVLGKGRQDLFSLLR